MHKSPVHRVTIYLMVGLSCAAFNTFVYHQLLEANVIAFVANILAFLTASQPSFWLHDRKTFGDRNPELTGWSQRWREFMGGNVIGFLLNTALAALFLIVMSDGHAHLVALLITGLFSIVWNNFVPFRDKSLTWFSTHRPSPTNPVVTVEH